MYLVREVFQCKPGKVRALIEKFKTMSKLGEKAGMPPMRIMTDMAGAPYWTLVGELEVESLEAFENMMKGPPARPEDMKELEKAMDGYHDLVVQGRREIYRIES